MIQAAALLWAPHWGILALTNVGLISVRVLAINVSSRALMFHLCIESFMQWGAGVRSLKKSCSALAQMGNDKTRRLVELVVNQIRFADALLWSLTGSVSGLACVQTQQTVFKGGTQCRGLCPANSDSCTAVRPP